MNQIKELEVYREKLETTISLNQSVLGEIIAKQKLTGEYSDPIMFSKIKKEIRDTTGEVHAVNRKIKEIRQAGYVNKDYYFHKAAKDVLPSKLYDRITTIAHKAMSEHKT